MNDRLVVVGAGYVGLATAVGLAAAGHWVQLVEADAERLATLAGGRLPIHEPAMAAQFAAPEVRRRIELAASAEGPTDCVLVCVGTPIDDTGTSDLRQIRSALRAAAPLAADGAAVVIRSTLPVGSTAGLCAEAGVPLDRVFANPEFMREGHAFEDFVAPTRVVIGRFGEHDPALLAAVRAILEVPGRPCLVVGTEEASLIKNGSNAFLALKLSFANELASLSEELGTDVLPVLEGIGLDPRIGTRQMQPSFGFGGACLPKELQTIASVGAGHGLPMHIARAAAAANLSSQQRFADRIERRLGSLTGRRVALLGLAFKAATDDVRDSPALGLARRLGEAGARVLAWDPQAGPNARRALPKLALATSAEAAAVDAEVIVIATEWPEFKALDWAALRESMTVPIVFDGRRLLDPATMTRLGFEYHTIGLRSVPAAGAADIGPRAADGSAPAAGRASLETGLAPRR